MQNLTGTAAKGPHCENCGAADPSTDEDGYTCCCNELVCWGEDAARFGIPTDFMRACCWAVAAHKFAAAGREVPEGSSRLWDR